MNIVDGLFVPTTQSPTQVAVRGRKSCVFFFAGGCDCQELWLGLIDFEKAFDTVEHDVLWEVLKDQGLHPDYIDIIKRLYDGQTAFVQAGAASRRFPLLRGVKQGAPVSALLFIAVMEQCFRSLKKRWKSANREKIWSIFRYCHR